MIDEEEDEGENKHMDEEEGKEDMRLGVPGKKQKDSKVEGSSHLPLPLAEAGRKRK